MKSIQEVYTSGTDLYTVRDSILKQSHSLYNLTYVNTLIYLYELDIIKKNHFSRSSDLKNTEFKIRERAAENHQRITSIYEKDIH